MPVGFTLVNKLTPEEGRDANLDITGQFCVSCDNAFPVRRPRDADYYYNEEDTNADPSKQAVGGPNSTFDVFTLSGASLAEASEIARKLTLLTQTLFKVWLEALVVDLIKAWNGKMYFLQVRSEGSVVTKTGANQQIWNTLQQIAAMFHERTGEILHIETVWPSRRFCAEVGRHQEG